MSPGPAAGAGRSCQVANSKLRFSAIFYGRVPGLELGAPGAPGLPVTEKWQKSAIFISPGLLTDAWTGIILQDETPKLPENLENKFRIQEGGGCQSCAAGAAGVRKEKNGLLHVYIATETGVDSVHRLRSLPLTPNSELQTLANQGPWVLSWDAGRAGRLPPDWKVIHKIVELGVALNLDS